MTTTMKRNPGLRLATMTGITAMLLGAAGCKSKNTTAPIVGPDGGDPAAANSAPPYTGGDTGGYGVATNTTASGKPTRVLSSGQSFAGQASGEAFGYDGGQQVAGEPGAAPIIRQAPLPPGYGNGYDAGAYDQGYGYDDAATAGEEALAETDQPPPPLAEYDQPPAPEPDDLWTPGYWNYASAGYYWVPGVWVAPPYYGALWTPPWWGFYGGHYRFHRGYWGSHVGFYGGIDYGFGYIGTGYYGGYWRGHDFFYNRAVTNVNMENVHNVYNRTVVFNNRTYGPRPQDRVAFNGGQGGIHAQPNASEIAALHEAHYAAVPAQRDNRLAAAGSQGQFARSNGGRPAMAFASHAVADRGRPAIAEIPREQPINHPAQPGVGGGAPVRGSFGQQPARAGNTAPATGGGGQRTQPGAGDQANARALAGRTETTGHGADGSAGQAGFQRGRAVEDRASRSAVIGQRSAAESTRSRQEPGRGAAAEGVTRAPSGVQGSAQGRFGATERQSPFSQRGAAGSPAGGGLQREAPTVRQEAPEQRPAPAFQGQAARPEVARPQPAPGSAARPEAAPAQHAAPVPHAAPAAQGGHAGGGDHGGHH